MSTSELCITKDALLRSPDGGLTYPLTAQPVSPFVMSGAPLSIPPQSVSGLSEYRRKSTATTDTSNLVAYFAQDNYYLINLASENIYGADPNTTLRFQNQSFTLSFMAIHAAIWDTSGIQISLVFTSAGGDIFHICIPITYDGNKETANPLINSLFTGVNLPAGSTMNQILNFGEPKSTASFATLEFCLYYNRQTILKPYTFCIFKTSLKADGSNLPGWLNSDRNLINPQTLPTAQTPFNTYRRKTFDEIFNYFMKGVIPVYVYDNKDPYLIGTEPHFDNNNTQNATIPSYFEISVKALSGTKLSSFDRGNQQGLVRQLNNVKCYPIDLASQIDEYGNIYVDENTNTPINVSEVIADQKGGEYAIDLSGTNVKLDNSQSWIRFIIAFSIIFLILISIIVVGVVFIFRGTSFNKPQFPEPAATLAGAVGAANSSLAPHVPMPPMPPVPMPPVPMPVPVSLGPHA